jgi:hypothetical protein
VQKIADIAKCIEVFKQFKTKEGNKGIFEYIKKLSPEEIKPFESYSKVFSSIIELDRNEYSTLNNSIKLIKLLQMLNFFFSKKMKYFYMAMTIKLPWKS